MPRRASVPAYCHHKASGRAVVRLNGKDHYLGEYGSPESHDEYAKAIARWRAAKTADSSSRPERIAAAGFTLEVAEVLLLYRDFAESYYVKNGKPTKELADMKYALRPVRYLYGDTLAKDFGPRCLKMVRQSMIDGDLSRGVINNRVNRIKRFFKWAVAEELVPPSVYHGLQAVTGLKYGRTEARETEPIKPVDDQFIEVVLPKVAPQVSAMIQLQRLTGMRPCETVMVRKQDIDTSGEIWLYEPYEHKNSWRGHRRVIAMGPKCQALVKPYFENRHDGYLFSPNEAEQHRNTTRRLKRKSPMTPSQRKRRAKSKPKRAKRDHYDTDSYRRAIKYAITKINKDREDKGLPPIPAWFPLQLRHSRATELNEIYGIEAAAVSLGHAHADVTKVYAERNLKLAIQIAKKAG